MRRFVMLGLLALSGCAAPITTNLLQLTPANAVALQDGTPIARLYGYPGNPQATVSFTFADGDTLTGNAIIHRDAADTSRIWPPAAQPMSNISTVEMVALDDRQAMECRGSSSPEATDMTCNLSDGAIYREAYVGPPPRRSR